VFGVQDRRRSIEIDLDSGPQQLLVVGALSVENHKLISDLGDEQLQVQAASACGDHRHLDGLIWHVVRACDADPFSRVLNHRCEEFEVVVIVKAGAARQDLGVNELIVIA
jgi:hypothetical protein